MTALRGSWHRVLMPISSTCCTSEGGLWAHRGKSAKPMFKYDMFSVLTFAEMTILHSFYSMFLTLHAPVDPGRASILLRLWCAMQFGLMWFSMCFLYANSHTHHSQTNMRAKISKHENLSLTLGISTVVVFYVFDMLLW